MKLPNATPTAIACVLAFTASASAADYTVTDLGTFGAGASDAWNINNAGQVVGYYGGGQGGFLYSSGVMTDIGSLAGGQTQALGINDQGQIVGISRTATSVDHAFVYQNGAMTDLGTIDNALYPGATSFAQGINNLGQIVGGSDTVDNGRRPFIYDGSMHSLGAMPGYAGSSIALGVNDAGQVTGYAYTTFLGGDAADTHAYLWQSGQFTDLGTLGGAGSVGTAINSSGHVIGYSTDASGATHAFVSDGTSPMIDLGAGVAWGVNDLGQAVGSASVGGGGAMIFENGLATDLNTLIPQNSGWLLYEARDINNQGQIVGTGIIEGQYHAFLMTPVPEPSTLFLGAFALVGLCYLVRQGPDSIRRDQPGDQIERGREHHDQSADQEVLRCHRPIDGVCQGTDFRP